MKHDGVSVTAVIVLAAFVIERGTAALLFMLSFSKKWRAAFPDPGIYQEAAQAAAAERRSKLIWFVIASALVIITLSRFPEMLVLQALGIPATYSLDFALSWLILLAGSDRAAALLGNDAGESESASLNTYQVGGEVTVVEDTRHTTTAAGH